MVTNVGEDGSFSKNNCFFTLDLFWFEEIVSGNGKYQEISGLFNEQRYAWCG